MLNEYTIRSSGDALRLKGKKKTAKQDFLKTRNTTCAVQIIIRYQMLFSIIVYERKVKLLVKLLFMWMYLLSTGHFFIPKDTNFPFLIILILQIVQLS